MFSEGFLLKGVAAPALAAFAAAFILGRRSASSRGVAATAYAFGQALGIGLALDGTGQWLPTRNLQWTPWLGVAAAAIGPALVAAGVVALERWLLAILAALGAAALLVPNWPELSPPRPVSMASFVLAVTLIARGTDAVTRRTSPRLVMLTLSGVSLLAAMLIAASLSLSLGEAALTTAAALSGTVAALWIRPDEAAVRGLSLPFAIVAGGWCYVTAIELPPPTPPLVALLFLPATPLVLWLTAVGPLSRLSARGRLLASTALVLAYLSGIGTWTWFSTEHESPY